MTDIASEDPVAAFVCVDKKGDTIVSRQWKLYGCCYCFSIRSHQSEHCVIMIEIVVMLQSIEVELPIHKERDANVIEIFAC